MKSAALAAALAFAAPAALPHAAIAQTTSAQTSSASGACAPQGDLKFICDMVNVEDFLPVDGGKYLVGGSYKEGSVGMYLIDTAAKTRRVVNLSVGKPDPLYKDCPGAPNLKALSTHGVDVRPGRGGVSTVYMINHGGRESVEVFRLRAASNAAEWLGCVVAPEGTSANSVVGLPDGSIVFTKLFDTRQRGQGISPVLQGKVTGVVYHWVPGKGISPVPGTELSGDNGIVASPDGKTLYINAYGTKEIWRVPLSGQGERKSVKVAFNPDNLRWAPDGTIFATGQYLKPGNPPGPNDWGVARIDPRTMQATQLLKETGTKAFDNATSTVQVGRTMFFGTFRGDRVAYRDAP